ncbi:hypothetical protein CF326_g3889 [Tilletia indica]|nr:hypothetical protein CF326_g3889 [Tilletia indica]
MSSTMCLQIRKPVNVWPLPSTWEGFIAQELRPTPTPTFAFLADPQSQSQSQSSDLGSILPSPSQSALDLLDPKYRAVYEAAYKACIAAFGVGCRPNWQEHLADVLFIGAPEDIMTKIKQHFDAFFDRISETHSVSIRPITASQMLPSAANNNAIESEPDESNASDDDASHSESVESGGSTPRPVSEPGGISGESGPSSISDSSSSLSPSPPLLTPPRPSQMPRRVRSPSVEPVDNFNCDRRPLDANTRLVSNAPTCTSPSKRSSTSSGMSPKGKKTRIHDSCSRTEVLDDGKVGAGERLSSSKTIGPSKDAPVAESGVTGEPSGSLPCLSPAARSCLNDAGSGLSERWTYLGLFRYINRLTDERPLTFAEAAKEVPLTGAVYRYPLLRERWRCIRCKCLLHEPVGHTTNLTKHVKRCYKD